MDSEAGIAVGSAHRKVGSGIGLELIDKSVTDVAGLCKEGIT